MKMTGNTVLIAGATSGIGLGLALRLHEAGNTVIVSGRSTERLARIAEEHPGVHGVELDITDPEAITSVTRQVIRDFPDLDVVVAMAGVMLPENLHDSSFLSAAESTITTNLLGPLRLVAATVEHLAGRPQATIVTVSSGLAFVPLPLTPTYNATKAAVHSWTQSLRAQLADTGIQVLELVPPAVRTTLMGQQNSERALPLDDFLDEVTSILDAPEQPEEILVKAVEPLRFAERDGRHADMLRMLSQH